MVPRCNGTVDNSETVRVCGCSAWQAKVLLCSCVCRWMGLCVWYQPACSLAEWGLWVVLPHKSLKDAIEDTKQKQHIFESHLGTSLVPTLVRCVMEKFFPSLILSFLIWKTGMIASVLWGCARNDVPPPLILIKLFWSRALTLIIFIHRRSSGDSNVQPALRTTFNR